MLCNAGLCHLWRDLFKNIDEGRRRSAPRSPCAIRVWASIALTYLLVARRVYSSDQLDPFSCFQPCR